MTVMTECHWCGEIAAVDCGEVSDCDHYYECQACGKSFTQLADNKEIDENP